MLSNDAAFVLFIFLVGVFVGIIILTAFTYSWLEFYWHMGGSVRKAIREKLAKIRKTIKN